MNISVFKDKYKIKRKRYPATWIDMAENFPLINLLCFVSQAFEVKEFAGKLGKSKESLPLPGRLFRFCQPQRIVQKWVFKNASFCW